MKTPSPAALALLALATAWAGACATPDEPAAETAAVADARLPEVRYYVIADT